VFVLGGTPAGIAAAVRAGREGQDVALATYNDALGGMLANGVCVSDTHFKRPRSALYDEFVEGVRSHYRETFGADSDQYDACKDGYLHEPSVAEAVLTDLVDAEQSVDVYWRDHPTTV
jgi:thioredoxin reductase